LPLDPRFAGSNPAKGDKYQQHAFLQRGSKAIGHHVIRFYNMLNYPLKYKQRYFVKPKSTFPLPVLPALLLNDSAGRIARELR
jgi:hypothetical protein